MPSSEDSSSDNGKKQAQGRIFERLAADYFIDKGFEVLERNWRAGHKEIDIIVKQNNLIIFVEVKSSFSRQFGHPVERVDRKKINNLTQAKEIGVSGRLKCRCANVLDLLPKLSAENQRYDIVMIAPPQYKGLIDQTLKLLAQHELLIPEGMAICQHDSSETVRIDFETSGARIEDGSVDRAGLFEIAQQRKYGNTTFTVLKRR